MTGGYLLAALLALRHAVHRGHRNEGPGAARPWWLLSTATLFLGLNKELDLQILFTDWGKTLAREGGWLGYSRLIQKGLVVSFALTAVLTAARFRDFFSRFIRKHPDIGFGFGLVTLYVFMRAADSSHFEIGGKPVFGQESPCWVIEAAGVSLMLIGVLRTSPRRKPRQ